MFDLEHDEEFDDEYREDADDEEIQREEYIEYRASYWDYLSEWYGEYSEDNY